MLENKAKQYQLKMISKGYSVPYIIFDENKNIKYATEGNKKDFVNLSYLEYYNPNKVVIIHKEDYLFSVFGFYDGLKRYITLIGPYGILDLKNYCPDEFLLMDDILYSKNRQERFQEFLYLLCSILNNTIPEDSQIEWKYVEGASNISSLFWKNLEERRLEDNMLDSIELENRYINAICRKDLAALKWLLQNIGKVYLSKLSSNRVLSLKYKIVALITLVTRAVINEGVAPILAYSLSDSLIQKLDTMDNIQECIAFVKESSILFIKLIDTASQLNFPEIVKEIIFYINRHIYEKITLEDLANHTSKHPAHLSAIFKKYTGKTIHKYLLEKRVKEAKHFLLFTDKASKDISNLLCFSTQSHFIEKFKQMEGLTPEEFRKKYKATRVL